MSQSKDQIELDFEKTIANLSEMEAKIELLFNLNAHSYKVH